jgi:hypothetical protein
LLSLQSDCRIPKDEEQAVFLATEPPVPKGRLPGQTLRQRGVRLREIYGLTLFHRSAIGFKMTVRRITEFSVSSLFTKFALLPQPHSPFAFNDFRLAFYVHSR